MKWDKSSPHQSYIKIVDLKKVSGSYLADQSGGVMVPILGLECRGLIPVRWVPGVDGTCVSVGGKVFEDVDLQEGDWAEYDDENDLAVSITNLEHCIERS